MVRKMAKIGFSYLLGLFSASLFLSSKVCFFIGITLFVITVSYLIIHGHKKKLGICVCVISFTVGAMFYSLFDLSVMKNVICYDCKDVHIDGRIVSYSDYNGDNTSYTVKGKIDNTMNATVIFFSDSTNCRIGDYVSIDGKAATIKNSFKFNTGSYYKAKGIYLQIGTVKNFSLIYDNSFSIQRIVNNYHEYIFSEMRKVMQNDELSVTSAILFGDKSGISSNEKTLMYRAGIGHIMAVSGVHLSVVCSFFWLILSWFPINNKLKFFILLIPLGAFILLAGMSNSVMRAAIMIILVYSSELFKRKSDTLNSLGIAVILLTIGCPYAVRDASFLLSVGGVFGIGVVAPIIIKAIEDAVQSRRPEIPEEMQGDVKKFKLSKTIKLIISSICTTIVIFPISFLFFDEISIISPLSNLILMPICTFILIIGVIVTLTGAVSFIAFPLLKICGICCKFVLIISKFIGSIRFGYIPLGYDFVKYVIIVCLIIIVLGAIIMRNVKQITILSVFMLSFSMLVISVYKYIPDNKTSIVVLKEKSASVMIIHDKKSASVIDLYKGGKCSDSVVKYLNRMGIYTIDMLILNVDSLTSQPIYINSLELFDVTSVLVPENSYYYDTSKKFTENVIRYDKISGSSVDLNNYSLYFYENNIELDIANTGFMIYDGTKDDIHNSKSNYNTSILYQGNNISYDFVSDNIIILNDKIELETDNFSNIYDTDNYRIDVYDKK